MVLAGRKPKAPALKILEGNPGHRPIPEAPKAPPQAPKQPSWAAKFPPPPIPGPSLPKGEVARVRAEETAAARALAEEARQQQRDAAAMWRRVVPVLDRMGLLSTVDEAVLTDLCVCWAQIQACVRTLSREGRAVKGERGWQKHPDVTALNTFRTALRGYIAELGLGPSSRGRLVLAEGDGGEPDGPFD